MTHSVLFSSEIALCDAACERISDEEITEWISECREAEKIREDAVEGTDLQKNFLIRLNRSGRN